MAFVPTKWSCSHINPTLFALQSHPGFKVVHLHLQSLQSQVALPRLAFVGYEYHHNEEDEQGACCSDADDGSAAERAVGGDVHYSWGKLDTTHAGLEMSKGADFNYMLYIKLLHYWKVF